MTEPIENFPKKYIEIIEHFNHRDELLRLLNAAPEFIDLLESHPTLGYLYASRVCKWNIPISKAALILRRWNRVQILRWINFGMGNKSTLKILQKVLIDDYSETNFRILFRLIQDQKLLDFLKHPFPSFDVSVEMVGQLLPYSNLAHMAPTAFRNKMVTSSGHPLSEEMAGIADIISDIIPLGARLNIPDAALIISKAADFEAINRLHRKWYNRLNEKSFQEQMYKEYLGIYHTSSFPAPPINDTESIRHLYSFDKLMAHGKEQSHCSGIYIPKVMGGECALFETVEPLSKSTVEIRLIDGQIVGIRQHLGAQNKTPPNSTVKAVRQWVRAKVNCKTPFFSFFGIGGVGKTACLSNLAVLLAQQKFKVLLVDGANKDHQHISLMLYPNTETGAHSMGRRITLRQYSPKASGTHPITIWPLSCFLDDNPNDEALLLKEMSSQYDVILLDVPSANRTPRWLSSLFDVKNILVVTPNPAVAKNSLYLLKRAILSEDIDLDDLHILINRLDSDEFDTFHAEPSAEAFFQKFNTPESGLDMNLSSYPVSPIRLCAYLRNSVRLQSPVVDINKNAPSVHDLRIVTTWMKNIIDSKTKANLDTVQNNPSTLISKGLS